jgi:hypothetical protein
MKAIALTILLTFCSVITFAADTTIVKVMKKAIQLEIPSSYSYFYLLDKANTSAINENVVNSIKLADTKLKALLVKDLVNQAQNDTISIRWSKYHLPKAKCVNKPHVPQKGTWDKINASLPSVDPKTGAIVPNTANKIDPKALEEISFVIFSKPVFSSDKQYALVTTWYTSSGNQYLFKQSNGNWELVSKTGWIQ